MMWDAIVIGTFVASLLVLLPRLRAFRDLPTLFVLLAIWSRYLLAGLHTHTYSPVLAGFSIIALHSLAIIAAGFFLIPPRLYMKLFLLVFYILIFMIVFVGALYGNFMGTLDQLTRWLLFLVVALLLFRAMAKFGVQPTLQAILIIAATPLALQFIGIALGIRTPDQDGNYAYLAGYQHGGLFSQMLVTLLFAAILIRWQYNWIPLIFVFLCVTGVTLANYRTSVISIIPAVVVHLGTMIAQDTAVALRRFILFAIIIIITILFIVFASNLPERFQDVPYVIKNWYSLIKPPHEYTQEESDLFTGRVGLWAEYIYAWTNGNIVAHLFGFGPGSFQTEMPKKPHNGLIIFLYQFGLFGVLVFFAIFASQTFVALRAQSFVICMRLLACLAGFFIINMATEGVGGIEALILFAVLCATTWAYAEGYVKECASAPESANIRRSDSRLVGARWRRRDATGEEANTRAPRFGDGMQKGTLAAGAVRRRARRSALTERFETVWRALR